MAITVILKNKLALKPGVDTSPEKNMVRDGADQLYCVWSNTVTLNKTYTMILVCAADDFRKYKIQKLRF